MDLNQLTIASNDVKTSLDFYLKLGLNLIVDALPRYVRLECPNGEATLSISKTDQLSNPGNITIYFEDDDLDKLVVKLKSKGINILKDPEDKSYLWREALLKDPDGNKLILYKAGKNRKNPPWRIN